MLQTIRPPPLTLDTKGLCPQNPNNGSLETGIDIVFRLHPELRRIGSPEQYSSYLTSIFPESCVRNVFFHCSNASFHDDGFKAMQPNFETLNSIEGVFNFSSNLKFTQRYGNNIYCVILDVRKPLEENWSGEYIDHMDSALTEALYKIGKKPQTGELGPPDFEPGLKDCDAFINNMEGKYYQEIHPKTKKEFGLPQQQVISVFDPSQIHILGSKQDRLAFEEYTAARLT